MRGWPRSRTGSPSSIGYWFGRPILTLLDTPGALQVLDLAALALAQEGTHSGARDAVRGENLMQRLLTIIGLRLPSAVA